MKSFMLVANQRVRQEFSWLHYVILQKGKNRAMDHAAAYPSCGAGF